MQVGGQTGSLLFLIFGYAEAIYFLVEARIKGHRGNNSIWIERVGTVRWNAPSGVNPRAAAASPAISLARGCIVQDKTSSKKSRPGIAVKQTRR